MATPRKHNRGRLTQNGTERTGEQQMRAGYALMTTTRDER